MKTSLEFTQETQEKYDIYAGTAELASAFREFAQIHVDEAIKQATFELTSQFLGLREDQYRIARENYNEVLSKRKNYLIRAKNYVRSILNYLLSLMSQ